MLLPHSCHTLEMFFLPTQFKIYLNPSDSIKLLKFTNFTQFLRTEKNKTDGRTDKQTEPHIETKRPTDRQTDGHTQDKLSNLCFSNIINYIYLLARLAV